MHSQSLSNSLIEPALVHDHHPTGMMAPGYSRCALLSAALFLFLPASSNVPYCTSPPSREVPGPLHTVSLAHHTAPLFHSPCHLRTHSLCLCSSACACPSIHHHDCGDRLRCGRAPGYSPCCPPRPPGPLHSSSNQRHTRTTHPVAHPRVRTTPQPGSV